MLKKQAKSY